MRRQGHKQKDKLCVPRRLRGLNFLLRGLKGEWRVRRARIGGDRGGRHAVCGIGNWLGREALGAKE